MGVPGRTGKNREFPYQNAYAEADTFGSVYSAGLRLLQPVDPERPCAGFREYVRQQSCKKLGSEHVNGRKTQKWEITSPRGGKGHLWVDPRLAFVIKMRDEEGLTELRNIKEGPQPPSLFELPAGYRRMETAGMRETSHGGAETQRKKGREGVYFTVARRPRRLRLIASTSAGQG